MLWYPEKRSKTKRIFPISKKVLIKRRFFEPKPQALKKRLNATPKWTSRFQRRDMKLFYKIARDMTAATGIKYEVDHVEPLIASNSCGLHVPWNLRIITKDENVAKGSSHIEYLGEWCVFPTIWKT